MAAVPSADGRSRARRPVLVLGLLPAGLAVARSLGRLGIPIFGGAFRPNEFGLRSRYLQDRCVATEPSESGRDRRMLAFLRGVAGSSRAILVPERDEHVDFVLRNWDEVHALADVPLPPDPEVVRRLRRKDLLPVVAAEAGVPAPRTLLMEGPQTLDGRLEPPFLLKPIEGQEYALAFGKKHGRTCVSVFDAERHASPGTERSEAGRAQLVAQVAASGALKSVFQPIFDLRTGRPRGYEALSRPMPGSGFTDATDLFTAAEAFGRTVELDLASLTTSIAAFAQLALPASLTLNISPRSLESDQFSVHGLVKMLQRHGVDPARVVLELTEREAVEDMDRLIRAVEACRAAGMRVAADDVGAGNAGLRLLSQIRFDIVKIDLSLIHGGTVRATSHEVVQTLKDLADRWGALVIAEGIETAEQLEFVRSLGIRAGQGYLLGMPAERPTGEPVDLDALLRSEALGLGAGLRPTSPFGFPGT